MSAGGPGDNSVLHVIIYDDLIELKIGEIRGNPSIGNT